MRPRLLAALLLLATPAAAQLLPTARDEREPNAPAVLGAESRAGILPSQSQIEAQGIEVNRLYRDLTGQSAAAPASAAPLSGPPMGQEGPAVNQLYRDLTGQSAAAPAPADPPSGPPMAQEGPAVNQLFRELTGQNPATPR